LSSGRSGSGGGAGGGGGAQVNFAHFAFEYLVPGGAAVDETLHGRLKDAVRLVELDVGVDDAAMADRSHSDGAANRPTCQ